ncbi:conserved hypothetical protein, partial [Campylobacter jejuni subsp. jejuni DFVF1099]
KKIMKAIIDNIKILEQNAINKGLDELILMENAGLNLAKLIKKKLKNYAFNARLESKNTFFIRRG